MKLGRYEILEELGRGGMGIVYRARDSVLGRFVALKVLHSQLTVDPGFIGRFEQEARLAAQLEHPNLVPVYDLGQEDGRFFIAMGLMTDGSLKDKLKANGALSDQAVSDVLMQILRGMQFIHDNGVVHRDLKPGNILFDQHGTVRISDLGFAKAILADSSTSLIMSGGLIGTPAYMAPEIWRGKPATPQSDIYSLGCIVYEMVTGQPLFEGETPAESMTKHLIDGPQYNQELSDNWRELLNKCLAINPKERYQHVSTILEDYLAARAKPETDIVPPQEEVEQVEVPEKEDSLFAEIFGKINFKPSNATSTAHPSFDTLKLENQGLEQSEKSSVSEQLRKGPLDLKQTQADNGIQIKVQNDEKPSALKSENEDSPVVAEKGKNWLQKALIGLAVLAILVFIIIQSNRSQIRTTTREIDGMEMAYVPAGEFEMGSNNGDDDEKPVHRVNLDAYWIDKYEVSNAQYALCVVDGDCTKPNSTSSYTRSNYYGNPDYDNYPVIYVSWHQAQAYCQWAGGDLPTEAQWEKAARGTDGSTYPWGDESPNCQLANYDSGNYCVGDTSPVTNYESGASPYGAMNMAGNVWEWVGDWYNSDYYSYSPAKNPTGPTSGVRRVLRGGSWIYYSRIIRAANRSNLYPTNADGNFGFRCALPQP